MTHKTLYVVVSNARNERTISCGNYYLLKLQGSYLIYFDQFVQKKSKIEQQKLSEQLTLVAF